MAAGSPDVIVAVRWPWVQRIGAIMVLRLPATVQLVDNPNLPCLPHQCSMNVFSVFEGANGAVYFSRRRPRWFAVSEMFRQEGHHETTSLYSPGPDWQRMAGVCSTASGKPECSQRAAAADAEPGTPNLQPQPGPNPIGANVQPQPTANLNQPTQNSSRPTPNFNQPTPNLIQPTPNLNQPIANPILPTPRIYSAPQLTTRTGTETFRPRGSASATVRKTAKKKK
jgi:hypothetical protein